MDSLHPPPLKKYRRLTDINIPVLECKREFNLPHKFPSMINSSKCNFIPKDYKQITITNTEIHNNLNGLNTKKTLATSGIKKLRVKTRDGKDLGEVKVQFLPQKNILNTQKIIYNQQIKNYKKNNAVNFSVASKDNINGLLKSFGSLSYDKDLQKFPTETQHCAVEPQFIVKTITPRELSIAINKKSAEIQNKNKNVSKKQYILAKVNEINENDKLLLLSESEHKSLHNNSIAPKTMQLINNNMTSINKEKNETIFKKEERIFKNNKKNIRNRNNNIIIEPEILRKTNISNLKNSMTQLAESKYPLVKCEKLSVTKTKLNVNRISSKATNKKQCSNLNIDNCSNVFSSEKTFKSNNNVCNSRINENKKYKTIIKNDTNIVQKNFNNTINDCNEDDVVIICEKNITSNNVKQYSNNVQEENYIPVNNKNIDKKGQSIFNEVNNKLDLYENKNRTICNNDNILNNDSKFDETNVKEINDNMKKEKLLECLNIIKEALTSVKDEELQIKALNALAECGIGIAKQIPITPFEKLKTVHDSQIQTDVFGLLDMKSFILVKEDMPALERIKQIEHSTDDFLPIIKEVQTQTEIQIQPKTKQNNNMDLIPTWSSISLEDTLNLEDYFNKHFNDNNDINRIKKVLSTPHYLYKKVSVQIEKDYEEMQHWDNSGMLNIHRAVLNNQFYELQRLLLILKASKTNIDALTEDGMVNLYLFINIINIKGKKTFIFIINFQTSLELAIKCNASNDIVDLLLKAGAKPVSLELLHESAVIIASKQSSPFLLQLLNYVIDPKLLNQVDSSGKYYNEINQNVEFSIMRF